jgi:hypothetical protein
MTDLLYIILENSPTLHPKLLCSASCVSSRYDAMNTRLWSKCQFAKNTYPEQCQSCHKTSTTPFGYCKKCLPTRMITTATVAKKMWYLNDDDLIDLNVYETKHQKYKTYIRLFSNDEVICKALTKHGGPRAIQGLKDKSSSRGLATKAKRIDALKKIGLYQYSTDPHFDLLCISDFMKNGIGGIRQVKLRVKRWDEFETAWKSIPAEHRQYIDAIDKVALRDHHVIHVAYGDIGATLAQRASHNKDKQERKQDLVKALKEVGLQYRYDSTLCHQYVEGTSTKSLKAIVDTMVEMDYFHKHTNYKQIMSGLIQEFKSTIREYNGWLPADEFREMLQNEMPYISAMAKERAKPKR